MYYFTVLLSREGTFFPFCPYSGVDLIWLFNLMYEKGIHLCRIIIVDFKLFWGQRRKEELLVATLLKRSGSGLWVNHNNLKVLGSEDSLAREAWLCLYILLRLWHTAVVLGTEYKWTVWCKLHPVVIEKTANQSPINRKAIKPGLKATL